MSEWVNRDQTELSAPCPVYPQQLPNSGHHGSAASGQKETLHLSNNALLNNYALRTRLI
jgi:hypothetical protein